MGALTNYVTITIQRNSVGITRAGLRHAPHPYTQLRWNGWRADTLVCGYLGRWRRLLRDTTSMEYRALNAAFAQEPGPTKVKFGKLTNKPTMKYEISIATVRNLYQYIVDVEGKGVTPTAAIAVATDGSATNDEAVALIVTALNAVVGKNYTAAATGAGGSQIVTVTGTNPGDWFSLSVRSTWTISSSRARMSIPAFAADLNAIKLYD
jgi:hypothetical protein